MINQYFLNVAVKDAQKSKAFFESLGFTFEPKFSNQDVSSFQLTPSLFLMCLNTKVFESFTPETKLDVIPHKLSQLNSIMLDSIEEVDRIFNQAILMGAIELRPADTQADWMYGRSFMDLDGYGWELGWLDYSKFTQS